VKTQITDLKFALTFPKFSAVSSLSLFSVSNIKGSRIAGAIFPLFGGIANYRMGRSGRISVAVVSSSHSREEPNI
jgi:hypothetical protein